MRAGGSLSAALEELERTDPAVADAAAKLEQAKQEILAGGSYRTRARRAIAERRQAGAVIGDETTPTPGTPIDENHRGLCHRAHPGMRHGEWERKRRGWPPYRRAGDDR